MTAAPSHTVFTWHTSRLPGVAASKPASETEVALSEADFSVLDHPTDHVATHRSTLTGGVVTPVAVGGRLEANLPCNLVLELVKSRFSPSDQDAVRPLTLTH